MSRARALLKCHVGRRRFSQYYTVDSAKGKARVPLDKVPSFYGHCTDRMMRYYNEDRYFAGVLDLPDLQGNTLPVYNFSIFDGHGGTACSEFLKADLAKYVEGIDLDSGKSLANHYAKDIGGYWRAWRSTVMRYSRQLQNSHFDDLVLRLPLAFLQADLDFIAKDQLTGSTATSAFIYAVEPGRDFWEPGVVSNITVAQVGDTRAILGDSMGHAFALTTVHHPSNPHEIERLKQYSGAIFLTSDGQQRFMQYANTRAFGDRQGKSRGISAEPDITSYVINGEHKRLPGREAFLILVSDGVTDKASDQELVDIVIQAAQSGGSQRGTPQAAAEEIVKYVEMLGTEDNSTAMVIRLGGWGKWDKWANSTGKLREERLREGPARRL